MCPLELCPGPTILTARPRDDNDDAFVEMSEGSGQRDEVPRFSRALLLSSSCRFSKQFDFAHFQKKEALLIQIFKTIRLCTFFRHFSKQLGVVYICMKTKKTTLYAYLKKNLDFAWWNSFEENKNSFDSINLENNDRVLKQ